MVEAERHGAGTGHGFRPVFIEGKVAKFAIARTLDGEDGVVVVVGRFEGIVVVGFGKVFPGRNEMKKIEGNEDECNPEYYELKVLHILVALFPSRAG